MNSSFAYLQFLKIAKEKRKEIILDTYKGNWQDLYDALYSDPQKEISELKLDTYEGNWQDLYDALYSDPQKEISELKLEYYELKWISSYWKQITLSITRKEFTHKEKKELISKFSKRYDDFICSWGYSSFDKVAFDKRREILKSLIIVDNDWKNNIKRMEVTLKKDLNMLDKKIEELKED